MPFMDFSGSSNDSVGCRHSLGLPPRLFLLALSLAVFFDSSRAPPVFFSVVGHARFLEMCVKTRETFDVLRFGGLAGLG